MNTQRTMLVLGTLISCNLFAGICKVFNPTSNPDQEPASLTVMLEKIATLPEEIQDLVAPALLRSAFDGKATERLMPIDFTLKYSSQAEIATWNRDGKYIALIKRGTIKRGTVKISETESGSTITLPIKNVDIIEAIALSPDGTKLAYCFINDKTIYIWDIKAEKEIQWLNGHAHAITSLTWNSDDRITSGSLDKTIKTWDIATGQNIQTLGRQPARVNLVAINPNDTLLASAYSDGSIKIWDTATGKNIQTLKLGKATSIAWRHDGKKLALALSDETLKIIDTSSWQTTSYALKVLKRTIHAISWSPNDDYLISYSHINTLSLCFFPQPLLKEEELNKATFKQALFLILLYIKRTTFKMAMFKENPLANLHEDLSESDALEILLSFSPETQALIKKRYNLSISTPDRAAAAAEIVPDSNDQ